MGTLAKVYPQLHHENQRNLVAEREKWSQTSEMNARRTHAFKFRKNQLVAVQHHATKEWSLRGNIVREVAPRSYEVNINRDDSTSYVLRRNQKLIRKLYARTTLPKEISNSLIRLPAPELHRKANFYGF